MSDRGFDKGWTRTLLFAATDVRSLLGGLVTLSLLLAYSVVLGEPTPLEFAWGTAPPDEPAAVTMPELVVEDARLPSAPTSRPARTSDPDQARAEARAVETAAGAQARAVETAAGAEARAAAETAANVEAATRARAEAEARAVQLERARIEANRAAEAAAAPTGAAAPPSDAPAERPGTLEIRSAARLLDQSESHMGAGDVASAGAALDRALEVLAPVALTPEQAAPLQRRVTNLRDAIEVSRLEADISEFVAQARVAQEAGDYSTAIALMRSLDVRVQAAPLSRRAQMQDLLDLFRVEETVAELVEACEFEREFLGRTEPCEG